MYDSTETEKHAGWRRSTVTAIIKLRTWAIRYGASPLKAWDMTSERVRLATRRATSVESWISKIMRSFKISSVDAQTCGELVDLTTVVGPDSAEWLTFVEDEHQFLLAMSREQWDATKKSRKAKTEGDFEAAAEFREKPKKKRKPRAPKNLNQTPSVPDQGSLL